MKKLLFITIMIAIGISIQAQAPEWDWAVRAGGAEEDNYEGGGIITAGNGDSYITGSFKGTADFGFTSLTSSGYSDIFVAKLNVEGNWLWAVRAGGSGYEEQGYSITKDSEGNSYITGSFRDTANFGTSILTSIGYTDIFVAKLDAAGNWLWARRAGSSDYDFGEGISTDNSGNIYVTGYYKSIADFGLNSLTSNGYEDIFIAKLDTDGNWLWVKSAGGVWSDFGTGISTDASGCSYLTGSFQATTFFGSFVFTTDGESDIYVAKLDAAGNWVWATKAGGTAWDAGRTISIDNSGNSYIIGHFVGTPSFGTISLSSYGVEDIFIAKLDTDGNWLWAEHAGGSSGDFGYGIITDSNGNSCITGEFRLNANFGTTSLVTDGGSDICVAKLDTNGNWVWAKRAGGAEADHGVAIGSDSGGNNYITGEFSSNVGFGSISLTSSGGTDIYVAKLGVELGAEDDIAPEVSDLSKLYGAYPNPFHWGQTTTIKTEISKRETGNLTIYNLKGQKTARYKLDPGSHETTLSSYNLPSGIYLYRLTTQSVNTVKRLVLLK